VVFVGEETTVAQRSWCTQTGRWPAIRLVSIVAGLVSLTAVILSATPPRAAAQSPDPTLLPIATTAQIPLSVAYDALNVLSMAAGSSYLDPTTGVKVYKLTSGSFPAASPNWGHDYAEGGYEVSLPHTGNTRTVLVYDGASTHWLLDFSPDAGVSNPRPLTGTLRPYADISFTFSSNPATPYYAYVGTSTAVRRFDVRTMTEVPGDGWPTSASNVQWLTQSENDGLFAWLASDTTTMTAYEPRTGTKKTAKFDSGHQVQVDKGGRYIFWSLDGNAGVIWDFRSGSVLWNVPGDPGIPFAHTGMLRRRIAVTNWNAAAPYNFGYLAVDIPDSEQNVSGPAASGYAHTNGGWIQNPADLNDQWALTAHYGIYELSSGYLAPSGLILWTINGGRRLLAHTYDTSIPYIYTWFPFAKFSADGNYAMFTSDMDGAGRSDVFLAAMPASTTLPVVSAVSPASVTAGAASFVLTVTGSNFVSGSIVRWAGANRATTFVSSTQVQTTIPASDLAGAGTASVTVVNPDGGISGWQTFTINAATADIGVYRPSTGQWFILRSRDGTLQQVQWGATGDIPVPRDYDGDGTTDIAVYRPGTGVWYVQRSSDGAVQEVQWGGAAGDIPVPRDYDGDGKADFAVFRPSSGTWYIARSRDGAQQQVQWGADGDIPVPRDYDGDGTTDLAVYRPSTGAWYILRSSDGTLQEVQWGGADGDTPVPGDYDGDGTTDLAVYRPSTGVWYILRSSDGAAQELPWGAAGDIPVPGDYDGDGTTDLAFYRPSTGWWYILRSRDGAQQQVQWGVTGDQPLSR
jgi:hypothetical protein